MAEKKGGCMERMMRMRCRAMIVFILAVVMLATPVLAQEPTIEEAVRQAEVQVEKDVSPLLWGGFGFLCSIVAPGVALFMTPSPPATALIGKPSEYVLAYTTTYKRVARNRKLTYSVTGCAVSALLSMLLGVL